MDGWPIISLPVGFRTEPFGGQFSPNSQVALDPVKRGIWNPASSELLRVQLRAIVAKFARIWNPALSELLRVQLRAPTKIGYISIKLDIVILLEIVCHRMRKMSRGSLTRSGKRAERVGRPTRRMQKAQRNHGGEGRLPQMFTWSIGVVDMSGIRREGNGLYRLRQ